MSTTDNLDYTLVLPVYYNEESLLPAYERLLETMRSIAPQWKGELVYVDDGSKDNSYAQLLTIFEKKQCPIQIIKLSRNFGQVMAIRAGIAHARADTVMIMSADAQDPPELLKQMLDAHFSRQKEVVICTRANREDGFYRAITSKTFYHLMRAMCIREMPQGGFDCFLLGSRAKAAFLAETERQPFLQGQILRLGFSREFIPYVRQAREFGVSRWTLGRKITYFLDGLLNYSFLPIRIVSGLGFLLAFLGLSYAFVVLLAWIIRGNPVQGWTPLMIVILLLGGAQMLTLGIFGEYIWRILTQAQQRAPFTVEAVHSSNLDVS